MRIFIMLGRLFLICFFCSLVAKDIYALGHKDVVTRNYFCDYKGEVTCNKLDGGSALFDTLFSGVDGNGILVSEASGGEQDVSEEIEAPLPEEVGFEDDQLDTASKEVGDSLEDADDLRAQNMLTQAWRYIFKKRIGKVDDILLAVSRRYFGTRYHEKAIVMQNWVHFFLGDLEDQQHAFSYLNIYFPNSEYKCYVSFLRVKSYYDLIDNYDTHEDNIKRTELSIESFLSSCGDSQYAQGVKEMQAAINNGRVYAQLLLVYMYLGKGNMVAALKIANDTLEVFPYSYYAPEMFYVLLSILHDVGYEEILLDTYKKMLEYHPKGFWVDRAELLMR